MLALFVFGGMILGIALTLFHLIAGNFIRSGRSTEPARVDTSRFVRDNEGRYIVFKIKDLDTLFPTTGGHHTKESLQNLALRINTVRRRQGKRPLRALVLESDWQEYEPAWDMLAQRVTRDEDKANLNYLRSTL